MMISDCKKCLLNEIAEADVIESINLRIEKLSEKERCSDDVYNERLSLCKECESLISGVCMKCGCYVQFRAAFNNQNCPDVRKRRW